VTDPGRRAFLAGLAGAVVAATGIAHLEHWLGVAPLAAPARADPSTVVPSPPRPSPPPPTRVPLPAGGVLNALPGNGNQFALTLDDGVDSNVVRLYTQFAKDSGVRLTYFVNGVNPSWTENRPLLAPLVESGQIQLGNHTWSHPDLTTVGAAELGTQLTRNERFLMDTYGVDPKPYLRPPYGKHNHEVRTAAADLGYSAITMWDGSLSDSTVITEDYIAAMADKYFQPRAIVIGHLNHPPVTHVYDKLLGVIHARQLQTVTLADVFTV
jgi:peptidoglycan-N-acetylglucosamine deacetylase